MVVRINSRKNGKKDVKCHHKFNPDIKDGFARCLKCRHIARVSIAIIAAILVSVLSPNVVMAWDLGGLLPQTGGGYYAGQQDAIYDHTNNLNYNPQPQLNIYHSPDYWQNFRQGYDQQWNSYQSSNVYVNNSPGASVTVGQDSQGPRYQGGDEEGWSGIGNNYQQPCCLPPPPPPPPCGCGCGC